MVYMVYQLESPDITTIIDYCEDLLKDEKIEVYDFGKRRDLVLHIYVDEDFASKSIEYKIFTFRDGELVDNLHRTWIDLKLYANNKREKKYEQNKSFYYSK